jgi:hypothetical protein
MDAIDYVELPAPKSESLAINQQPMSASRVETRAAIKRREAKEDDDFTSAIQTAFEKEWQAQLQHEIQEVEAYLQQLLIPQYTSALTDDEKEALAQEILTHLQLQQDIPKALLTHIQAQFTKTDSRPPPPKLELLNLNELLSTTTISDDDHLVSSNDQDTLNDDPSPPEDSSTAHIVAPESSPDATSLKSNTHFLDRDCDIITDLPDLEPVSEDDDHVNITNDVTPSPSNATKRTKPTTKTPTNCEQRCKRITEQQAHRYLGFRTLRDFKILNETGNGNTSIINNGVVPLELGNVANLRRSRRTSTPVPRPPQFLSAVHMDIGYGDCVAIGGVAIHNHVSRSRYTIPVDLRH